MAIVRSFRLFLILCVCIFSLWTFLFLFKRIELDKNGICILFYTQFYFQLDPITNCYYLNSVFFFSRWAIIIHIASSNTIIHLTKWDGCCCWVSWHMQFIKGIIWIFTSLLVKRHNHFFTNGTIILTCASPFYHHLQWNGHGLFVKTHTKKKERHKNLYGEIITVRSIVKEIVRLACLSSERQNYGKSKECVCSFVDVHSFLNWWTFRGFIWFGTF